MQKYKNDSIEWLEFDLLSDIPHLKHAVFLRNGGSSNTPYTSFNTSFDVGDTPHSVQSNINKMKEILQIPHLYWCQQVHGSAVKCVNNHLSPTEMCDSLITSSPNVGLMIKHADCQAALFYDPINHAIANVHAGWRGSVKNIYLETIQRMHHTFGSDPHNLLVCISPSLGPESAEFIHYRSELPEEFWTFQVKPNYFDFWAISENQLINAGVLSHHIEIARIDTYTRPAELFSARRDKITGRHATCIYLKNSN